MALWPKDLPMRWAVVQRRLLTGEVPHPDDVAREAQEIEDGAETAGPNAWDLHVDRLTKWRRRRRHADSLPLPRKVVHDPRGLSPAQAIRGHKQRSVSRYRARVHLQLTPWGVRGWVMSHVRWPALRMPALIDYWSENQIHQAHKQGIVTRHETRMLLGEVGEGWLWWTIDRPPRTYLVLAVLLAAAVLAFRACH